MKKGIVILALPLLVASVLGIAFTVGTYSKKHPKININNKSGDLLTNVEYGTTVSKSGGIDSLLDGNIIKSRIFFDDDIPGDGGYYLSFLRNGNSHYKAFGYFTNGASLDNRIVIDIMPDTTICRFY